MRPLNSFAPNKLRSQERKKTLQSFVLVSDTRILAIRNEIFKQNLYVHCIRGITDVK